MSIIRNGEVSYEGKVLTNTQYRYIGDGDGYLYVLAWNDTEKKPDHVFISHSGYDSDVIYTVDATPEVVAQYEEYKKNLKLEQEKRIQAERVRSKLSDRKRWISVSRELGMQYPVVMSKLRNNKDILSLLETKVRSEFKKSLKNQVIMWLNDSNPKYDFPLSPRQLSFIAPKSYWR